jgi:hypothetical protein
LLGLAGSGVIADDYDPKAAYAASPDVAAHIAMEAPPTAQHARRSGK